MYYVLNKMGFQHLNINRNVNLFFLETKENNEKMKSIFLTVNKIIYEKHKLRHSNINLYLG